MKFISRTWAVFAGALWSFIFAGMSFYWAAGGMMGLESLGGQIYRLALERDPDFLPVVWLTGIVKVMGGVLLLFMLKKWHSRLWNKMIYYTAWIAGIVLLLYGAANFTTIGLAKLGWLHMELNIYAIHWRLYFWEPFWMVGGVLYMMASIKFKRISTFSRVKS
ncbi:DUF3995 domain-containing protein [Paenibacillus sp. J2TS4]|uniref:DUF3995 domain-containing protein n=1 Tax=Paenibacillus sp. J2TS4 TaxID=2807194 RepID=UPI001B1097D3|nr:DUF3995 domain-containing protein [Paenibacillus sp. J2TS4]GIP32168.1 hypothetical protein J2TS4_13780 [Paenibacillus sp. J2TS4]